MSFTDREIICRDCATQFTWTAGQQEFFRNRELAEPKRCPACRQQRRRDVHLQMSFNARVPR